MEPSSEPRRHAQSPMSLRLFYYTAPWVDKSCLGAASARERRRLDHQGPRSTSHSSGAALGHPERPPGASQGPAGPHEGCVRGTDCIISRVKRTGKQPRGSLLAPSLSRGSSLSPRVTSLSSVAAQKVRYWVRHFGRVFTFSLSVPQRQNPDFDGRASTPHGARSARFFQ